MSKMNMKSYQIRPIKIEDNPTVAKIIRKVMTEFKCVGEGYSIADPEVDSMFEAYDNNRSAFYIIEDESTKKVLGCGGIAQLKGSETHVCELQKMYFLNEARGKGLGQRLLDVCMGEAINLEYTQCYLETTNRMKKANSLYLKNDFKEIPNSLGCTGHDGCDTFYLKELVGNRLFEGLI